jgi:hypothetical protein
LIFGIQKKIEIKVTHGLSGKVGDLLVFRQRDGKTVVSTVPHACGKVSDAQLAHRRRFQHAAVYGNAVRRMKK